LHRLPHGSKPGTVPLSIGQGKPTGGVGTAEPTLHRLVTHFPATAPIPFQTRGLTARQPQQITAPTSPPQRTWARTPSSSIGPRPPGFGHARADHGRGNVVVSEELLNRADVIDRLEQAGDTPDDSPTSALALCVPLYRRLVGRMSAATPRPTVPAPQTGLAYRAMHPWGTSRGRRSAASAGSEAEALSRGTHAGAGPRGTP